MTTKQIEELREAAKVATSTLRHHGVEMHPDDILGLVQDVAATLTERSQTEEGAREVLQSAKPGWVMVPREPTEAMIDAGSSASFDRLGAAGTALIYKSMLSASPEGEG